MYVYSFYNSGTTTTTNNNNDNYSARAKGVECFPSVRGKFIPRKQESARAELLNVWIINSRIGQ